jgi:hypothetical protein
VRFSGKLSGRWSFGPLRRDEPPRNKYVGTYNQDWIDNRMPLLPVNFDSRHNQVAPPGQISPQYLLGDEQLRIANLYQDGQTLTCPLPGKVLLVTGNVLHRYFTELAVLDTVLIWSQRPMISLVWRHPLRVRQKIEEAERVQISLIRRRSARELFGGA